MMSEDERENDLDDLAEWEVEQVFQDAEGRIGIGISDEISLEENK